jgi:hypothetical protein
MIKIAKHVIWFFAFNCLWIGIAVSLLPGCANVTFHPEAKADPRDPLKAPGPDLTTRTGLKYYNAKPYLLIGPTGNKDAPLKADVVYLPDLTNPTYAIYHPGWGQHIFSLAVAANGSLSSYGQTADSKIPETISALGSLMGGAGSLAAAIKPVAAAMVTKQAPTPVPKILIEQAIAELSQISSIAPQDSSVRDCAIRAETFKTQLTELINNGNLKEEILSEISTAIEKSKIDRAEADTPHGQVNYHFKQAKDRIDEAIRALKEAAPKGPDFRLYEIKVKDGKTELVRVPVTL